MDTPRFTTPNPATPKISIKGLTFDEAWPNRQQSEQDGHPIWYLSKEDLITAKKAVAREQDLKDIAEIQRADQ